MPSQCWSTRESFLNPFFRSTDDVRRWLPSDPLIHCIAHTGCKVAFFDHERAQRLAPELLKLKSKGVNAFVVFNAPGDTLKVHGFEFWKNVLNSKGPSPEEMLAKDPHLMPEDNATIIFTSGTYVLILFPYSPGVLTDSRKDRVAERGFVNAAPVPYEHSQCEQASSKIGF